MARRAEGSDPVAGCHVAGCSSAEVVVAALRAAWAAVASGYAAAAPFSSSSRRELRSTLDAEASKRVARAATADYRLPAFKLHDDQGCVF